MAGVDIRIYTVHGWLYVTDYERKAFQDFLAAGGEEPFLYSDTEKQIKFTIKKSSYKDEYELEREDGESFQIRDWRPLHGRSLELDLIYATHSSSKFTEAKPVVAYKDFEVYYDGGLIIVEKEKTYFVDSDEKVLVGCHGTVSPPCDTDGHPIL